MRAHLNWQRQERLALGPDWTDSGYVFVDEAGVEFHPHRFTKMFEDASAAHQLAIWVHPFIVSGGDRQPDGSSARAIVRNGRIRAG